VVGVSCGENLLLVSGGKDRTGLLFTGGKNTGRVIRRKGHRGKAHASDLGTFWENRGTAVKSRSMQETLYHAEGGPTPHIISKQGL